MYRFLVNQFRAFAYLLLWIIVVSDTSAEFESRGIASFGGSSETGTSDGSGLCVGPRCTKSSTASIGNALWFGPRLGRKRRNGNSKMELGNEIEEIANMLQSAGWNVIAEPVERKRQRFIPRLGREAGEEFLTYDNIRDFADQLEGPEDMEQSRVATMFAPRFGRKVPFSPTPRLGRDLRNILARV